MRLAIPTRLVTMLSCLLAAPALAQSPVQKVQLVPPATLASLTWQVLASDPKGDVRLRNLPDAKELSYAIDAKTDTVWFKVTLHDPLPPRWFGMNIAIDSDGNPDNGMAWWGTNKVKFDRLASAYLFKAEGYWQGTIGVTDSAGAGQLLFDTLSKDVAAAIDPEHQALALRVPRAVLGSNPTVRVIATVGSAIANNDDTPNEGMATVKLTP